MQPTIETLTEETQRLARLAFAWSCLARGLIAQRDATNESMKMTVPIAIMLRQMIAGKAADDGLDGRSQRGGFTATLLAARRRGWVTQDDPPVITDDGRKAYARHEARRRP